MIRIRITLVNRICNSWGWSFIIAGGIVDHKEMLLRANMYLDFYHFRSLVVRICSRSLGAQINNIVSGGDHNIT